MLHEILHPVRQRLRWATMLRTATVGLLWGAGLALAISMVRLFAIPTIHWGWPLVVIGASVSIGWLRGLRQPQDELDAARLVDEHYGLKDRSITSLQFVDESDPDSVRQLQIEEAQKHLDNIDPVACVPMTGSLSHLRWAGGLSAAMLMVLFAGSWLAPKTEAKSVLPLAQVQSSDLRETLLPELEELLDEQPDPELEELIKELEERLKEMDSETLDEADLLAKLSEMEQSLAEARESLQVELSDTMMKALAAAMKPSDMMKQAAEAIEAEKYDRASEELAAMDPDKMGDKQRRAVADNLKKMVSKLKPAQLGQLSESIGELAEGLESKNQSQCKMCLAKLASACKKQSQCKKIGQCMSCQLRRLSQCKSQCRSQCQGKCNNVAKSDSPSQTAGKGASGQPLGDRTPKIDSIRNEEHVSSTQSQGPSETEILQSPEGEQNAARLYAAKYDKFKREAEAVLNSEPLPMGHRETVRSYFEAIRPSNSVLREMSAEQTP